MSINSKWVVWGFSFCVYFRETSLHRRVVELWHFLILGHIPLQRILIIVVKIITFGAFKWVKKIVTWLDIFPPFSSVVKFLFQLWKLPACRILCHETKTTCSLCTWKSNWEESANVPLSGTFRVTFGWESTCI